MRRALLLGMPVRCCFGTLVCTDSASGSHTHPHTPICVAVQDTSSPVRMSHVLQFFSRVIMRRPDQPHRPSFVIKTYLTHLHRSSNVPLQARMSRPLLNQWKLEYIGECYCRSVEHRQLPTILLREICHTLVDSVHTTGAVTKFDSYRYAPLPKMRVGWNPNSHVSKPCG